ncbi:hypothetical protein D3C84_901140 [compost metagenome]
MEASATFAPKPTKDVEAFDYGLRMQAQPLWRQFIGQSLVDNPLLKVKRHFVCNRQRAGGQPCHTRSVLDQRRRHAFSEHGHAFINVAAEDPTGEEAGAVIDHDGRLAQLGNEIQGTSQGR